MYYSITKRIIKTALGFVILVCSFAFAFFIIHFGSKTDSFNSVWRSFLKIFVMILGEFEFEDLWTNLENSESGITLLFTMLLLVGLVVFGTVIMVYLNCCDQVKSKTHIIPANILLFYRLTMLSRFML